MECNLGSEIGQKMRSAVKAKLLELGTGGSSGFIDDELPDYVMVMVANKRTKQQMNAELNLFLGDQTDLFVTWLHEVLQKLQEVTLPTSNASSKKRRSRGHGEAAKSKEKDKKVSKKDKKPHRKSCDEMQEPQSSSAGGMPVITSITDVFADELMQKAKKSLNIDINAKDEIVQKKKKRRSTSEEDAVNKDSDITANTSEISSTTCGVNRQKDLAELAEIQKKIQAAKKHLRQIGEIDDESEEDDEDLLNLSAQDESVDQEVEVEPPLQTEAPPRKAKSPIIFKRREKTPEKRQEPEPDTNSSREAEPEEEKGEEGEVEDPQSADEKLKEDRSERRSVHDRLGSKNQLPPEKPPRPQKELYVPAHRRRSEPESSRERSQRDRSREPRSNRDTSRDTNRGQRQRRSPSPEAPSSKQRIGSRVIVAVHKPPEPSDDEDMADKPLNSVIKIQPRPKVSPRRQACKNLLLRAVADAQRSTILAKSSNKKESQEADKVSPSKGKQKSVDQSVDRVNDRSRDRGKRSAATNSELFRRSTRELVVNVTRREGKRLRRSDDTHAEIKVVEEEYAPSLSSKDFEAYVPQLLANVEDIDLHISSHDDASPSSGARKTQFVVTLNGDKSLGGRSSSQGSSSYRKRPSSSRKRSSSPVSTPQVSSSSVEPTSTTSEKRSRRSQPEKSFTPSPTQSSASPQTSRSLNRSEVLRQPQEVKKLVIKTDTDEDDEKHKKRSSIRRSNTLTLATSANGHKDNRAKPPVEERSTTPPLPAKPKPRAEKRPASKEKAANSSGEPAAAESSASVTTSSASTKGKHTPIRFTLRNEDEPSSKRKLRSNSPERDGVPLDKRRIPIRSVEDRKYDNLPALSAVSVDSAVLKVAKPKERCKYHPNCTKQFCEYYHPTAPCKSFPNCKFADKCMYSHPKCKYDMSCMSVDCNFAHSGQRDLSHVQLTAPPLSSHVIPVQNYKSISAPVTSTTATTMCKYYPNCSKLGCTFYHPKPCRFGKNCVNKLECIFYHPEMQSKFKWVASLG
ncbi:zinc finger CCCH domain-containing protein 14 [Drosophila kikkawai]|uniref:Zinc finger CCCH domain-containing protein 14 n=1 Tax=Drosophila kikkawai TaxID=30033 RepID=A0A6P4IBM2_DROKI|nr:zinc finger CCCH domain-containing protein 14 [Drosophila kikkawai]